MISSFNGRVGWKGWVLSPDLTGTLTAGCGAPIGSMEGLIVVAMLVVGTKTSRFSKQENKIFWATKNMIAHVLVKNTTSKNIIKRKEFFFKILISLF